MNFSSNARLANDDFWRLSDVLNPGPKPHHPFLVLENEDGHTHINIIQDIDGLLAYADETPVLYQWQGKWRSDFFHFSVGQARVAKAAQS